jgi:hypothetical protein
MPLNINAFLGKYVNNLCFLKKNIFFKLEIDLNNVYNDAV